MCVCACVRVYMCVRACVCVCITSTQYIEGTQTYIVIEYYRVENSLYTVF